MLERIKPKIALISVGKNNNYGHPDTEVISSLVKQNTDIYRTDSEGTVVLEANNNGWRRIN